MMEPGCLPRVSIQSFRDQRAFFRLDPALYSTSSPGASEQSKRQSVPGTIRLRNNECGLPVTVLTDGLKNPVFIVAVPVTFTEG
jgi:hypothetical protein